MCKLISIQIFLNFFGFYDFKVVFNVFLFFYVVMMKDYVCYVCFQIKKGVEVFFGYYVVWLGRLILIVFGCIVYVEYYIVIWYLLDRVLILFCVVKMLLILMLGMLKEDVFILVNSLWVIGIG